MKSFSCLSVLAFAFATSSFGADAQTSQMNLQGLKSKCAELSADEQLKPFTSVVSCRQISKVWRPAENAAPIAVQNQKEIGASFSLKSYSVPYVGEPVEMGPSQVACTTLAEYELTVPAVDLDLSCDDLAKVESIVELCEPAIQERLAGDPGIESAEATGKTFNACDPSALQK